jgi:hypothetical protein
MIDVKTVAPKPYQQFDGMTYYMSDIRFNTVSRIECTYSILNTTSTWSSITGQWVDDRFAIENSNGDLHLRYKSNETSSYSTITFPNGADGNIHTIIVDYGQNLVTFDGVQTMLAKRPTFVSENPLIFGARWNNADSGAADFFNGKIYNFKVTAQGSVTEFIPTENGFEVYINGDPQQMEVWYPADPATGMPAMPGFINKTIGPSSGSSIYGNDKEIVDVTCRTLDEVADYQLTRPRTIIKEGDAPPRWDGGNGNVLPIIYGTKWLLPTEDVDRVVYITGQLALPLGNQGVFSNDDGVIISVRYSANNSFYYLRPDATVLGSLNSSGNSVLDYAVSTYVNGVLSPTVPFVPPKYYGVAANDIPLYGMVLQGYNNGLLIYDVEPRINPSTNEMDLYDNISRKFLTKITA